MTRPLSLLLAAALLLLLAPAARADAPAPAPDRAALLETASAASRDGARLTAADPLASRAAFQRAAEAYQAIVDSGVRNGRLFYNLANAHLRAGDVGRAVLNYKRAARLIPGDPDLQSNLAAARARAKDAIPVEAERVAARTLLFFHYDLTPRTRAIVFLASFNLFWLLVLLRALARRAWAPAWALTLCALVALATGASLAADELGLSRAREAVVVAEEVVGRKGPDAVGYEPSFTSPLHAGAELSVLESRVGWLRARLTDGRVTWLPDSAVEFVDPGDAPGSRE
jgi:tetratricopeptide (TPR) repeat protein